MLAMLVERDAGHAPAIVGVCDLAGGGFGGVLALSSSSSDIDPIRSPSKAGGSIL